MTTAVQPASEPTTELDPASRLVASRRTVRAPFALDASTRFCSPQADVDALEHPSPATAHDDPGLFEARGTSVSPERADCTATRRRDGTWPWGPGERAASVVLHHATADALTDALAAALTDALAAAPDRLRRHDADGIAGSRTGPDGVRLALRGVLDRLPGAVEILPTREQQAAAREQLGARLGGS